MAFCGGGGGVLPQYHSRRIFLMLTLGHSRKIEGFAYGVLWGDAISLQTD